MPTFIDTHIGNRIRLRRMLLGISKRGLGETVGCEAFQISQFEQGLSRVSASMLFDMANALHVPVTYFFEKLTIANPTGSDADDYEFGKDATDLIASYHGFSCEKRKAIFECAVEVGKPSPDKLS